MGRARNSLPGILCVCVLVDRVLFSGQYAEFPKAAWNDFVPSMMAWLRWGIPVVGGMSPWVFEDAPVPILQMGVQLMISLAQKGGSVLC